MFARLKQKVQGAGASDAKLSADSVPSSSPTSKHTSPRTARKASRQDSQLDNHDPAVDDLPQELGLPSMPRADLERFAAKRHKQWHRGQEKLSDLVIAYKDLQKMNDQLTADVAKEQALSSERLEQQRQAHQLDIQSKSDLVTALTTRLEDEKAQVKRLEEKVAALSNEKEELSRQGLDATASISKNKREVSRLSLKVEHLSQDAERAQAQHSVKLQQLEEKLESLRVNNAQLQQQHDEDLAAIRANELEAQRLKSELKQANAVAKQLNSQPASPTKLGVGDTSPGLEPNELWSDSRSNQQVLVLESRLAAANLKLTNKESQCTRFEQAINQHKQETAALQERIDEMMASHKRTVTELETQLTDLEQELEECQGELRNTQQQHSKLTLALAKMESIRSTLEQDLTETKASLERELSERQRLSTQLRHVQAEEGSRSVTIQSLESQLASLKAQRDGLKAEGAETRIQLSSCRQRIEDLEKTMARLEEQLQTQTQQTKSEQSKVDELNAQVVQLCKDNAELNERLDAQAVKYTKQSDMLAERDANLGDLQAQLAALMDEHQLRCDSEIELNEQIVSLQTDITRKAEQAEAAESELLTCQSQQQEALAQITSMQAAQAAEAKVRQDLEARLQELQSDHQRRDKQQQQHISELKRNLARSMRGLSNEDKNRSAGQSQPTSSSALAMVSEANPQSNAEYLRNVIFKFIVAGPTESKHLVKVLSTLLKFTPDQERAIRQHVAAGDSWLVWPFTS